MKPMPNHNSELFYSSQRKYLSDKTPLICREEAVEDVVGKKCAETLRSLLEKSQVWISKYLSQVPQTTFMAWGTWFGLGFDLVCCDQVVPAGSLARVVEQLDRKGKVFLFA